MKKLRWTALSVTVCVALVTLPGWAVEKNSAANAGSLRERVTAQERAGLETLKTEDRGPFNGSIAEEAVFVDAHGPATKAEIVEHTAAFRLHDFTMSDVRFVRLGKESGLIVYSLTESGESHGREFSARVYVSAIWTRRSGKWRCLFSQETGAR